MNNSLSEEELKDFADSIPAGKLGTPQDVAEAVAFLASDKSNYMVGQVISPNGGIVM